MAQARAVRWGVVIAFVVGLAVGCAKNGRGTKDPNACMRKCDQEECEFHASSVGDNDAYLECLEGCQEKCG
jgi:hypothetical protein